MPLRRRALLGSVALSLAVAGCRDGGGGDTDGDDGGAGGPTPTPTATPSPTGTEGPATVQVRGHDEYGDVLVGPDEMTLYVFERDARGERASACHESCARTWPPLTVETDPVRGDGVTADLQTFERADGTTQVTAGGWPLYYFATDDRPGDTEGQGVGGVWWVLAPDGTPVDS